MEDFDFKFVLSDEAENEVEFEFLDLIEYQGEEFVVLLPCDEEDKGGEVVILKLEDTDDEENESYVSVDDESVLNAVFDIFKDKFKDEFNFVDQPCLKPLIESEVYLGVGTFYEVCEGNIGITDFFN